MHKQLNYPDRASFSRMTNDDAQAVVKYLATLEFPTLYEMSLQFALFKKTYGIPTISSLLVDTKEFSSPERSSKRYADTGLLISEFSIHPPKSERAVKAIARMNYLHGHYQKAGRITNDDLLYTLSVFITEPIAWVAKYEWRSMTEMEICAVSTFWKSMGDAMGINYEGSLPRASHWVDGLEFYEDIKSWAENYEKTYMVPAATNKKTADELVPLLLTYVPNIFQTSARAMVAVIMGDRLRAAMIYPIPSKPYFQCASIVFAVRKFILRHLCLPRYKESTQIGDQDPKTGRYYLSTYLARPFYNKPTFLNRWGPEGWLVRLLGGVVPGSEGKRYEPDGYLISEVGPDRFRDKGVKETDAYEAKLNAERPRGCPFAFGK
ncbi:hypothetical protein B0O99DRAFT_517537 [Bisporella sp. PMI_857]|nr:hypothetical protein B0O99DRAFT_517537 [Bisporella sp. PMI_857]